mmetsp:Transcript_19919/g.35844  ORF Transcript_19919/g.35844 Transcript_19919/m.35844 type:complete len:250 (-) Transcript_19919:754-1503(-)
MQYRTPILLILTPPHPHILKRGQTRQNAPPHPSTLLPLRRSRNPYPRPFRRPRPRLVEQPIPESGKERRPPRQHHVGKEGGSQIHIAPEDGRQEHVVHGAFFRSDEGGVEQHLGGTVSFRAEVDDLPVGELVLCLGRGIAIVVVVRYPTRIVIAILLGRDVGNVTNLLLHRRAEIRFGRRRKRHSALPQQQLQSFGDVASGDVAPHDGMRQCVSLVHRDAVRDALSDVQYDSGGATGGVEAEDCGWGDE